MEYAFIHDSIDAIRENGFQMIFPHELRLGERHCVIVFWRIPLPFEKKSPGSILLDTIAVSE